MDKLHSEINKYKYIIIAKHVNPDWDALGSAIGMKELINSNYKDKKVFIVGATIDYIELDNDLISDKIINEALLITVDTANMERVDFIYKDKIKNIFKIDHHINVDNYGKNEIVNDTAISCTQVIVNWAEKNKLKINKRAAFYLYKGLITDSNRFMYDKTNENTFDVAKTLIRTGIKIQDIYSELYLNDLRIIKWNNKCFSKAKFIPEFSLGYILIKDKDLKKNKILIEEAKSALFSLSSLKEINIFFIACEDKKNNNIRISLRSRNFDINSVAVKYNGGGHRLASGAKINKWSELKNIINDLKELYIKG